MYISTQCKCIYQIQYILLLYPFVINRVFDKNKYHIDINNLLRISQYTIFYCSSNKDIFIQCTYYNNA